MDRVQKLSNSECYILWSEPFRIYPYSLSLWQFSSSACRAGYGLTPQATTYACSELWGRVWNWYWQFPDGTNGGKWRGPRIVLLNAIIYENVSLKMHQILKGIHSGHVLWKSVTNRDYGEKREYKEDESSRENSPSPFDLNISSKFSPRCRLELKVVFTLLSLFWNKKFWEELIAYFPWNVTGHIENDASNNSSIVACVFVTAVTFLQSRCLATIARFLPSRCLAKIGEFFTKTLPSNDTGIRIQTHRLIAGIF
jgi:hypothetical protein